MNGGWRLMLGAAMALPVALAGWKALRAFRSAKSEFHLGSWIVGDPPAELGAEKVSFPAHDGPLLRGWWVPPRNGAVVVLLHGSENDRRQLLPEARALAEHGFGVMMFDWPGLGESAGRVTWSRTEPPALAGALDFVTQRSASAKIGALGFSIGATMLVSAAAGDARVRALVLEAPILDMDAEVKREYGSWGPITYEAARLGKRWGGWDPRAPGPLQTIGALQGRPLLVISGDADAIVTPGDARRLVAEAREPKELWIVPGSGHGGFAYSAAGYLPRIVGFFDTALR